MGRWISIPLLFTVILFAAGGVLWYFSVGLERQPPQTYAVEGLSEPVRIGWHEQDAVLIQAENQRDALTGLGYAHGMQHAWSIVLWRQAALGRLGEWFGESVLGIDRLTRRIGLSALAKESYDALPEDQKDLLVAYTRGLNAALGSMDVLLSEQIALLRMKPDPWEPWHTLALERLFAWLGTTPPAIPAAAGADARAFFESDGRLRDFLHLHGFENSVAWTVQDSSETYLVQRYVYGSTSLPLFQAVVLQWEGAAIKGLSLPGTPFLPTGQSSERAWTRFITSTFQLDKSVQDTVNNLLLYDRVTGRNGTEHLLTFRRAGTTLWFDPPPSNPTEQQLPDSLNAGSALATGTIQATPDSTWSLHWSGFEPVSDWPAWHTLLNGAESDFRLLDGDGLDMTADGAWNVAGNPRTVESYEHGILAGNTSWSRYLAQALNALPPGGRAPGGEPLWLNNFYSPWAAELAPALIASVDSVPGKSGIVQDALTYLNNWDYTYDRASIAASIFDMWISLYRDSTGALPAQTIPDTVYFENVRRYRMLLQAVQKLETEFGRDLSQWRWEAARPDIRLFPVWSADTLTGLRGELPSQQRFAPVELPGRGHPSTLYWGPSPVQGARFSPAAWESWTSTAAWDQLQYRRYHIDFHSFLGRYEVSTRIPDPVTLTPSATPHATTTLAPAG